MEHGDRRVAPAEKLLGGHLRYRQWLRRRVWPKLPGRPLLRFIFMYFIRLGILDGRAGLHLAQVMASYEYMTSAMSREKLVRRALAGALPLPGPTVGPLLEQNHSQPLKSEHA